MDTAEIDGAGGAVVTGYGARGIFGDKNPLTALRMAADRHSGRAALLAVSPGPRSPAGRRCHLV